MTTEQYGHAEHALIGRLQTMREAQGGNRVLLVESSSETEGSGDGMDDVIEQPLSSERDAAINEFTQYCRIVKMSQNFPRKYKSDAQSLGDAGWVKVGTVEEAGNDIKASYPFVKCNLANFVAKGGHFDLVEFLRLQEKSFPYLYKLALCLASLRTNEVGCERFFSIAGYVSSPRRTSLNVRNYECIAAMKRNMHQVYIDEEWVVQQYLALEKTKGWDKLESRDDLLVLNLERELLAEELGVNVGTLPAIEDEDSNHEVADAVVHEVVDDGDSESVEGYATAIAID
jgi:hypothetical protein